MTIMAVQKGNRGLFVANSGKYFFPDKSWKDACEGFVADISVVKDKGTYAFIRGRMLEVETPRTTELGVAQSTTYWSGLLGKSQFLLAFQHSGRGRFGNDYKTYVKVDGKYHPVTMPDGGRSLKPVCRQVDLGAEMLEAAQPVSFETDIDYVTEMCQFFKVYRDGAYMYGKCAVDIRVYDSTLVLAKGAYDVFPRVFEHIGKVGRGNWALLDAFPSSTASDLWEKAEPLDMRELSDLAYDYRICLNALGHSRGSTFDERLDRREFSALGSGIAVYSFNMNGYTADWFETEEAQPYIDLVEDSFARFENMKRRMLKIGGSSKEIFDGMNIRDWLFPYTEVGAK